MSLPLDGLTVIALEQAVAAPFASRQLADLGARVIKVERDTGDFARGYDRTVKGMSSYFVWLNRGKESIVLDLKAEDDLAALRDLLATADVFIQNLAPGAVERLGLGPESVRAVNPGLVYVSISGYGTGGPYETKKAYDLLIQCESGLLSVTGSPEDPAKVGISIADICAGMYAYSGILTALLHRQATGQGDVLEISMLDAMAEWMMQPLYYATFSGAVAPRSGAQHASIAPYGPFEAADGTVFLAIQNEREWANFCTLVLDSPSLSEDVRFRSNTDRVRYREDLHALISETLGALDVETVLGRLDAAAIANARLRSMLEVADHEQLRARDRWREIDTPAGPIPALLPPVSAQNMSVRMGAVPALGAHTDDIIPMPRG